MSDKAKKIEAKVEDLSKTSEAPNSSHDQQKTQEEILVNQLCEGIETYENKTSKVFLGAITAGLEIGFSFLLISILYTFLKGKVREESIYYITAFAYPVGFIMVVLGRSILFTEQTSLLTLPVLHKKRSIGELLKVWGTVISGNLIGGLVFVFIAVYTSLALGIISKDSIAKIALHVTKPNTLIIFGSAILAGWLMALLSWLVSSSKETISRIFVIYMITAIVGFAGFHHSIVGNIEVLAGIIFTNKVSFLEYLIFQSTTLLGNAFGGVFFVALLRYRSFASNF